MSLSDHRAHLLEDTNDKHRWDKFYDLCHLDPPNIPVVRTMEALKAMGCDVWFFSGRTSRVRDKTVGWLVKHTSFTVDELSDVLVMRNEGDHTPDDILKKSWYNNMLLVDKERLVAVFDDRAKVVSMWRDAGVACFQVAPGNF